MSHCMTEEFLKECKEKCLSQKKIAAMCGVTERTVRKWQRKYGIRVTTGNRPKITEKDKELLSIDGVKMVRVMRHEKTPKRWMVQCVCRCGKLFTSDYQHVKFRNVKSCGCAIRDRKNRFTPPVVRKKRPKTENYEPGESINKQMLSAYIRGAIERNLEWAIDADYLNCLFESQEKRCALSGVEIHLAKDGTRDGVTASLDRIDSTKGYNADNVQWIHKSLQRLKGNMPEEILFQWCKLITVTRFDHDKSKTEQNLSEVDRS